MPPDIGVKRFDVMYNDFVLVGPKSDPAGTMGKKDVAAALAAIAAKTAPFASRGDDSGTHKKEGVPVEVGRRRHQGRCSRAAWYRETGSGMGATLERGRPAWTPTRITDRVDLAEFRQQGRTFTILVEGDTRLFNQYGVILVNPAKFPHVKKADGQAFIDWLVSDAGQSAIGAYKLKGKQAFFPNSTGGS